jgi:outer membrane protein OmpA-like peptidoglycan-associated protein
MKFGFLFIFLLSQVVYAQTDRIEVWQGIMVPSGKKFNDAQVLWLKIPLQVSDKQTSDEFLSRQETMNTEFYALHKLTIKNDGAFTVVEEAKSHKKKLNRGLAFCRMIYKLQFNEATGYLEGTYSATDCRSTSGKVYLYRSEHPIADGDAMTLTHAWVRKMIDGLEKGKMSTAKMAEMRANFEFKPIFFDYDKAEIREEYKSYLKTMAQIVLSHSDLRIKVTGHTDGDGSDAYNLDLSKRRAQAILAFFLEQGLTAERVEIDFQGKRNPIAPNNTSEGKQRNRRVDFAFI